MISCNLRRFNQNPEWDVRQVLPIRGFFMSSPHLTASDKKQFVARCICSLLLANFCLSRNPRHIPKRRPPKAVLVCTILGWSFYNASISLYILIDIGFAACVATFPKAELRERESKFTYREASREPLPYATLLLHNALYLTLDKNTFFRLQSCYATNTYSRTASSSCRTSSQPTMPPSRRC